MPVRHTCVTLAGNSGTDGAMLQTCLALTVGGDDGAAVTAEAGEASDKDSNTIAETDTAAVIVAIAAKTAARRRI